MTARKHFKQLVRARMGKTGESYTTARRHLLNTGHRPEQPASASSHLPGSVPATTAVRVLLTNAGVVSSHDGKALSEAMVFGLAGGIGIGVFEFYYKKEDIATIFLGARHSWHDDLAYAQRLFSGLGINTEVLETAGARTAEKHLRTALAEGAPCIAWVDSAHLPHRAMPDSYDGSGYHVVTVYGIDDKQGAVLIGDCADKPISVPLSDFENARGRIKKQRNRILSISPDSTVGTSLSSEELERLIKSGLLRCRQALHSPSQKGAKGNFQLGALQTWAQRLHGSSKKDSWKNRFKPGANMWRGLTWLHDCVEHYGTGGGLCRRIMADFLAEAGTAIDDPRLSDLSEQYRSLGDSWSDLAHAALPGDVPAMQSARELLSTKAELISDGAPAHDIRAVWDDLAALESNALDPFPLNASDCDDLLAGLKERVTAIHEAEVAALVATDSVIG